MSFMFVIGSCAGCKRQITFSPSHVPSIRVKGVREPLCQSCVGVLNARRVADGLPEQPIRPDAYKPEVTYL